jgi:hypothetical protein
MENAEQAYAMWLKGNSELFSRGEPVMSPNMDAMPPEVRRALERSEPA